MCAFLCVYVCVRACVFLLCTLTLSLLCVREAIMATPYAGSFIAASCNSRSSHGQVHPFTKWDKVRCYVL
jgi:hypothetical protein